MNFKNTLLLASFLAVAAVFNLSSFVSAAPMNFKSEVKGNADQINRTYTTFEDNSPAQGGKCMPWC